MRYEYKVVKNFNVNETEEQFLNKESGYGWELVSVTINHAGTTIFYFKRPL